MIFSHRGNGTGHVPNTIPAFEAALAAGADGFECDLRITGDRQVAVWHDGNFRHEGKKVSIGRSPLARLTEVAEHPLLTLDALLDYIADIRVPAFLEVKNISSALVRRIVDGIASRNLWNLVHVIGFPVLIGNSLRARSAHPKLNVHRIQLLPAASLLAMPRNGDGALVGWQDSIPGSERLFRVTLPPTRLARLKDRYERRGMRLIAGVINRPDGFRHFLDAGIHDVVTDDVPAAVTFYKTDAGLTTKKASPIGEASVR